MNIPASSVVSPYLFFEGRCDEALAFYQKALGVQVQFLMRYQEGPEPACREAMGDKVMHASFLIGSTLVMVSDGRCSGQTKFDGVSLSLTVPTPADAEQAFAALSDGGTVQMPMSETFFSPRFGMVADRFGVSWMVYVKPEN